MAKHHHCNVPTKESVVVFLASQPLLLLALVCAIGLLLGRIRIAGAKLGSAAVLFVGLALGGVDPRLRLPDIIFLLGLSTLVYTLGLTSAATINQILTREGLKRVLVGLSGLTVAGLLAFWLSRTMGFTGPEAAGMYGGAFTNASGLASAVDSVSDAGGNSMIPVVTYSLAYPVGVFGPMLIMVLAKAIPRVNLQEEALTIPAFRKLKQKLAVVTLEVTNPEVIGRTIADLARDETHDLIFGRHRRGDQDRLASGTTALQHGDRLTVVGGQEDIAYAEQKLGKRADEGIELDRSEFEVRRIFVSRPEIVGRELRHLNLPAEQEALITRVRRGDLDFVPNGSTRLELGDRVRILARRERHDSVSKYFGDSYRALSEADLLTFCLGLLLGLLLGAIPIPLPGGAHFRLGFAGGPLIMALILGRIRRTGSLVWSLPYSANLTLRQFGLVIFSAGIGTRAGYEFFTKIQGGHGLDLFLVGLALTAVSGLVTFVLGYGIFKIPLNVLYGIYAGAQTQPVSLGFATEQTKNDLAANAYAALFPISTLFKIVIGQVLLLLLGVPKA